jgi:hypothetical protein
LIKLEEICAIIKYTTRLENNPGDFGEQQKICSSYITTTTELAEPHLSWFNSELSYWYVIMQLISYLHPFHQQINSTHIAIINCTTFICGNCNYHNNNSSDGTSIQHMMNYYVNLTIVGWLWRCIWHNNLKIWKTTYINTTTN